MPLTFEQPLWLAGVLLMAPLGVVAWRWFTTMSRVRRWVSVGIRCVLVLLLCMALAGASAVRTSDRMAVIAVVDVSDSMRDLADAFADFPTDGTGKRMRWSDALSDWIIRAGAARGADDLLGIVAFDGRSIAVLTPVAPAHPDDPRSLTTSDFTLDFRAAQGTDIADALRFASAMFPPDARRRIVLLSDGNQTAGDAVAAARELAGPTTSASNSPAANVGVPIDVVPIAYRVRHEVMIEAVDAPPQAPRDSTITLRVVFNSTDPSAGSLNVLYEGRPIDLNGSSAGTARHVTLPAGLHVELVDVPLGPSTIHRLQPVFTPDDPASDRLTTNNSAETVTVTPGKGRVLVVDGDSDAQPGGPGLTLSQTLSRAGIDVQTVPPGGLPDDILSMQAYDLVILQNVAAEEVPRQAHDALEQYVKTLGGGLVMIGGPDSFGAGGWKGTTLEAALPVKLDLPEELIRPSAAIVIVLDASGSMMQAVQVSGKSQQQVANEGAALAVRTLDKTDLVGVIAFDDQTRIVVPLGRNDDPTRAAERILGISPGGGTRIFPAMEQAGELLRGVDANLKHIIVLSDGRDNDPPEQGLAIAQRLHADGITVSTIAVGDGADVGTLAEIAQRGGGQYYPVTDPNTLPRVFVKEIRVVRKPLIREGNFKPIDLRSGSALLAGVNVASAPPLGGLVLTQAREDPKITFALATSQGEPVLAHWFYGRGQVAAFTSDATRWARQWIDWPGYSAMWTAIARTVARPTAESASQLTTEIVGDDLVVRMEALNEDGKPQDSLDVSGLVYSPSGTSLNMTLGQVGPGLYEGRVRAAERGNYVIALTPTQAGRPLPPLVRGATRAQGAEVRQLTSNVDLMKQIADATKGRVLDLRRPDQAALFDREGIPPRRAASPIWPILLAWCVGLFVLDVASRRVAWDRLLSRELGAEMRRHAAESVAKRAQQAAATIGQLRKTVESAPTSTPSTSKPPAARGTSQIAAMTEETAHTPQPVDEIDVARLQRQLQEEHARAERQRRLRQQMLQQLGSGKSSAGDASTPPGTSTPPQKPGEETTSSLRAAKKRAQERYESPPEGGPGAPDRT